MQVEHTNSSLDFLVNMRVHTTLLVRDLLLNDIKTGLGQQLAHLRRKGVCTGHGKAAQLQRWMQQLVLEREWLREECNSHDPGSLLNSFKVQEKASIWLSIAIISTRRRVKAPSLCVALSRNGSQSTNKQATACTSRRADPFSSFVHPARILRRHDEKTARESSDLAWAGVYLRWNAYHGTAAPGKRWLRAYLHCSKRMNCSIDSIGNRLTSEDGSSKWHIMATARDINVTAEIKLQRCNSSMKTSSWCVNFM
ncbi:hypothetical protein GQ600_9025 [Phytophthora cactorum]|nr:hypothetical protein GQ600_9025 [Phytophthora cactorum]